MNKVVHLEDFEENLKVPSWDENKLNGYTVCKCGYQRKESTHHEEKVTCKKCLKIIENEFKEKMKRFNYVNGKKIKDMFN